MLLKYENESDGVVNIIKNGRYIDKNDILFVIWIKKLFSQFV